MKKESWEKAKAHVEERFIKIFGDKVPTISFTWNEGESVIQIVDQKICRDDDDIYNGDDHEKGEWVLKENGFECELSYLVSQEDDEMLYRRGDHFNKVQFVRNCFIKRRRETNLRYLKER